MKVAFQQRYASPREHDELKSLESWGPSHCWAIGANHLLRSTDRGQTWANSYFASPMQACGVHPVEMAFSSSNDGFILAPQSGFTARLYYGTGDGGRSWHQIRMLDDGYVWANLFASPRGKLWSLIKQKNGIAFVEIVDSQLRIWERAPVHLPGVPHQILFADDLRGWILERWNADSWVSGSPHVVRTTTVLHYSEDGGKSWKVVSTRECSGVKLVLLDAHTLVMAGDDGIFLSTDNGHSWSTALESPRVPLLDVHFRGMVGTAVGTEGLIESKADVLILISTNGGKSWCEVGAPAADSFLGVRMMTWSSGVLASSRALYTFDLA